MKLKRILAKLIAGAMVVTSVPASSIGAVTAFAEVQQPAAQTEDDASAEKKTYRYRSLLTGVTATTDGVYREEGQVSNLVDSGDTYARSRYNTGGIPTATKFVENNNVYMILDQAQAVTSLLWWTQNQNPSAYGHVTPGTVTRYKVSLLDSVPTNVGADGVAADNIQSLSWKVQKSAYAIFDTSKDDNDNHKGEDGIDRVAHRIDLKELFGEDLPANVGAVRIEVLNTAGDYTYSEDGKDTEIRCNELEVFNGDTKIDNITPLVDFSTNNNQGASLLTDGNIVGSSADNVESDPVMQSDSEGAEAPKTNDDKTKLIENNNLYFTLDEVTNIGRLTYMAGIERGTIKECRIYVSKFDASAKDPSPKDATPKEAKELDDDEWTLVFSNVAEDTNKPGQTEKLENVDGKDQTVWVDPEIWSDFDSRSSMSWRHAHVAVFEQPYLTEHVRIEVVRTQGAKTVSGASAEALKNKWISGKRVYLFEAQEVKSKGVSIDEVEIKAPEPVFGTLPGRIELPADAPYTAHNMDWAWYLVGEDGEETEIYDKTAADGTEPGEQPDVDLTVGANVYRIEVKLRSKDEFSPWNYAQRLTINGQDVAIDEESWKTGEETVNGENFYTLTVSHTFEKVADPTEEWRKLKDYVENTAKPVYTEANGNKSGVLDNDGVAQIYTTSSWNRFTDAYITAKNWTSAPDPDDPENGGVSGGIPEVGGPSGHSAKEYQDQLALLTKCLNGLVKVADRTTIDKTLNVDVVASLPEIGETWQNADLAHAGGLVVEGTGTGGKEIVLTTDESFGVSADGYIRGKVTGAVANDEENGNSMIKIKNGTNFLIHTKLMLNKMITAQESIVGYFDAGYGLQIAPTTGGGIRIFFYGYNQKGGWPETSYSIAASEVADWLGKEHEIIAFHNGSKLFLYVDGKPSTDQRVAIYSGINCTDSTRFSIGWNADPTKGEEAFSGGINEFKIYVGEDSIKPFDIYKEGTYSTDEIGEDTYSRDKYNKELPDDFDFEETMKGLTPNVTINSETPPYAVTSTVWKETTDDHRTTIMTEGETFKRYHDYTMEVTVSANDGYKFDKETVGKLYKNQTEEADADSYTCSVSKDLSDVVYTYKFKNPDGTHPYHLLIRAVDGLADAEGDHVDMALGNKMSETNGKRKYTTASWQALAEYYADVVAPLYNGIKKNDDESIAAYEAAVTELPQKAAALKLAAENCECELKSISPKSPDAIAVDMGQDAEKDVDPLDALNIVIDRDGCIKCEGAEKDQPTYTYTADPADAATQEENLLTISRTGTIEVGIRAVFNDVTMNTSITYEVTGAVADQAQKDALQTLITEAKAKYPEDYYSEATRKDLADAIAAAEELLKGENVSLQDVNAATAAINAATAALEADTKAAAVANVKKAVANVKATYDAGQGNYTDDSWKKFTDAYDAANKDFTALNRLGETALADLITALNTAKDGLEIKKNPDTPGPNDPTPKPPTPPVNTQLADGAAIADASGSYKVKSAAAKTAVLVAAKNATKVKVPATVKGSDGNTYKVVEIAKGAFKGNQKNVEIGANVTKIAKAAFNCKKLNTVTFKGKKLPSMKKAFKKTAKKVKVKVDKSLKKKANVKKKTLKAIKAAGIKKATLK